MDQPGDDLVARAVAGDQEALVVLLKWCAPAVRSEVGEMSSRWRSLVDKEDIEQEIYSAAFEKIAQLQLHHVGAFKAWMMRLSRNKVIEIIRYLKAEKRGGDRTRFNPPPSSEEGGDVYLDLFEILGGTTTTPSRAAQIDEARAAIKRGLELLEEEERRVIVLRDIECRSAEDVAEIIGCDTPECMYMRRRRALNKLRSFLGTRSNYM